VANVAHLRRRRHFAQAYATLGQSAEALSITTAHARQRLQDHLRQGLHRGQSELIAILQRLA